MDSNVVAGMCFFRLEALAEFRVPRYTHKEAHVQRYRIVGIHHPVGVCVGAGGGLLF